MESVHRAKTVSAVLPIRNINSTECRATRGIPDPGLKRAHCGPMKVASVHGNTSQMGGRDEVRRQEKRRHFFSPSFIYYLLF